MANGKLAWRVMGTGSAIAAALVSRKVIAKGWQVTTGETPPANPTSPETTWPEALTWAVVSGALVGVARLLATRKAADYFRRSAGHLPPGMEQVS